MANRRFTPSEIEVLSKKRYVKYVNESSIKFSDEFKDRFIDEYYNLGKGPTEIFLRAGFDPDMIGARRISRCSETWRKAYKRGGRPAYADGGADAKGNKDEKYYKERLLSAEKELSGMRQLVRDRDIEINRLRAEVELLKKAGTKGRRRCEGQVYGNPDLAELIDEILEKYRPACGVKGLCAALGMKPSDYYYRKKL